MHIVSVRTHTQRWALDGTGASRGRTERVSAILELRTDDDQVFFGEAAPLDGFGNDSLDAAMADLRALAAPFEVATFDEAVAVAARASSPSARFAIETALLDAIRWLRHTGDVPSAVVVDTAEEAARATATTLKIKVGAADFATDLERVLAIHHAAPQATLRLDANRAWPRERVKERLYALAELPIEFIEEPCPDAHLFLGEALPIPIALDESVPEHTSDPIILKPTCVGGIAACLALAKGRKAIVTHALEGAIGTAACVALARTLPGVVHGVAPHPALTAFERAREVVVGTATHATVRTIHEALDAREPIAVLHPKLAHDELLRQRMAVIGAPLPADAAAILFTSGSTGEPRGIVLSRAALEAAADASWQLLGRRENDRWLLALSPASAGGLAIVVRCRAANIPIEFADDSPTLAAALARCTLASLVPTQLATLLSNPDWRCPPSVRAVLLGGAAAPPALVAEAVRRGMNVHPTYGLTETFGQVATAPRVGAPLVPLPGVEILAGTRDAPARIRVRGPMLATQYLDGTPIAPELVTADLGFLEDGALVVSGRADDVIISGGMNVHPAEVEAVLTATLGVRSACAFGVDDERWGQIVGAALATDASFDLATAAGQWHELLPPHARPRRIAVASALPLLPGGKVDRHACSALPGEPVRYG